MWRSSRGFTLVEVLVVMSILVMLMALGGLTFQRFVDFYRVRQAQAALSSAVREAQLNAYSSGNSWRIRVTSGVSTAASGCTAGATSRCPGIHLESASGSRADCSDDQTVWTLREYVPFEWGGVRLAESSGGCIVFGPTGRVLGPTVRALAESVSAPVLADARTAPAQSDPASSPYWHMWDEWLPEANIALEASEPRSFESVKFGIPHSDGGNYSFPTTIQVFGRDGSNRCLVGQYGLTSDGQTMAQLTRTAGNSCPVEEPESAFPLGEVLAARCDPNEDWGFVICRFSVPIGSRSPTIELVMVKPEGKALFVDEVDVGDLFFTLESSYFSRTVAINPVTGRVTIR